MGQYLINKPKGKLKVTKPVSNIVKQVTKKTIKGGKPATSEGIVKNIL